MPTYYPQIYGGVITQRPYMAVLEYLTSVAEQASGPRYGYAWRDEPLGRWELRYAALREADVQTLETFFAQIEGRLGEFTYLDPGGNLVRYSEDFSHSSWERYTVTTGGATTDPFGGNRAMLCTGTSGNSMLATYVLPEGGASGFAICGSVWVRAQAAQQLAIGFIDSGFNVVAHRVWELPAGRWVRIWCPAALATNSNIRLLIGGFGTWGAVTLDLFGAQCAPTPGPGGYQRTPGNYGLHAKCRFDQDQLEIEYSGPNAASAVVRIVEYR